MAHVSVGTTTYGPSSYGSYGSGPIVIVKPKIWEFESFSSEFCDGFSSSSSSHGMYDSIVLFQDLLKTIAPQAASVDAKSEPVLKSLIRSLERADILYRRMESYLNWGIQFHLSKVIDDACKQIRAMGAEDTVIIPIITGVTPSGTQNLCLMVITQINDSLCRVAIVNPNAMCSYHPKRAHPPKLKQQNVLVMCPIPRDRLVSEAFWSCVYLGTGHFEDKVFYTHFLTWLTKRTYEGQIAEGLHSSEYESPCKSESSVFWKSLIGMLKHSLRAVGIAKRDVKYIRFLLKQRMLDVIKADLDDVKNIKLSQRRLIETAAKNTAMSISRNSPNLKPNELEDARKSIDLLQTKLSNIPCDDDSTTVPPPILDIEKGWELVQQADQFPMMECFRRIEPIEQFAGAIVEQKTFIPVNLESLPNRIKSFEEINDSLTDIVRLITRLSSQHEVLKNVDLLVVSLITHFVIEVLPMPIGPKTREEKKKSCVWTTPKKYGQQLQTLMRLAQLNEYFLSACFSVGHSREHDATRMTVVGVLAVMCDALIRSPATDHPSLPSLHIAGLAPNSKGPFTFGPGKYASQTEGVEMMYPETLIARCGVLDYLNEVAESIPQGHIMWKWEDNQRECKATNLLLKAICASEGFTNHTWSHYLTAPQSGDFCILCKYFPDLRYYRDVVFYFKYLQHTRLNNLPDRSNWLQEYRAQPEFSYSEGDKEFYVDTFGNRFQIKAVGQRYDSRANPSQYTSPTDVACEDDILHIKNLPNFGDIMGQRDSELLLSYLTVPYLRIPLVLRFLATEDRVSFLSSKQVREMLDGVIFEPGRFLSRDLTETCPQEVPTENAALIATPYGLLLNELQFSTEGVIEPIIRLLELAREMDAGTVHNEPTTTIILYLIRLVARVETFLFFLLNLENTNFAGELRGVHLASETQSVLRAAYQRLRDMTKASVLPMLETWIQEVLCVVSLAQSTDEIDKNTVIACRLYQHVLVLNRNVFLKDITEKDASTILSAIAFLTTRHTWGENRNDKNVEHLEIPETEIYELLQQKRRQLLMWLYQQPKEVLSNVMDCIVNVATSNDKATAGHHEWLYVAGIDCVGRFARLDNEEMLKRAGADKGVVDLLGSVSGSINVSSLHKTVRSIAVGMQEVEFNTQTWALTFKAAHLQALPSNIAQDEDVVAVFNPIVKGRTNLIESLQCAVIEEAENRQWVRLVGQDCDIQWWKTGDPRIALPNDFMRFYPEDIKEHEKWLVEMIEPIRLAYLERSFWEPPIFILLPEVALTADQSVAILSAVDSRNGKKMKEIIAFRDYNTVHFYDVFSHGRRFYRSLIYTTDNRFCLHELHPFTGSRIHPWPKWGRHAAGDSSPDSTIGQTRSCIVTRHATHPENMSRSIETFIPGRLLNGLIPAALLQTHNFWQDADDNIRGYPLPVEGRNEKPEHLLWIHWKDMQFDPTGVFNTCAKIVRFAKARSAPRASEKAVLKSQKLKVTDQTEEELEMIRTMSSEGAGGDLAEGEFREASFIYTPKPESASVDDYNLTLVNLMHARKGTPLHSLANVFARVELLSHVLCWTTQTDYDSEKGGALTLDLIQLPRLKMSFSAKIDLEGHFQIFSMDHAHLFISNNRQPLVNELLQGIPHSLLLCDNNKVTSILVPNLAVVRPYIAKAPYSTELVLDRSDSTWFSNLDARYYLYPVHVSLSFMFTPTLSSALYVLLLRFLHRDYEDVFRLAGTIGTDMQLTKEEQQIFDSIGDVVDSHPNAHASRAKIGLLTSDSPMVLNWYNPLETAMTIHKRSKVTVSCRLSIHEERRLLFICQSLEAKMDIIREVAKSHVEASKLIGKRVTEHQNVHDGSLQERKQLKAFFKTVTDKFREKLDTHCTKDELNRLMYIFVKFASTPTDPYFACLLGNQQAYVEAESIALETGVRPQPATIKVPPIGPDLAWHLYRDFNALSVKPPGALTKLKNDEGRAVKMSPVGDTYYCDTDVRKSGTCKCKECGERCGPNSGCPCPSCDKFNKKEGPKLRQLPEDLNYNRSYRSMSFFEVFMWMRNLFSGFNEQSQAEVKGGQSKLRTIFDENNSFLLYYELLTGTTTVKIGSSNCAMDLPSLLFPFAREARNPNSGLGQFVHFLLNNPQCYGRLAKWNRTSKQKRSLRILTIYNSIFEMAALYREVPPPLETFAKIPRLPENVDVTPRPDTRTSSVPLDQTRILPVIPNTDCSKRKLEIPNLAHLSVSADDSKHVNITMAELTALAQNPLASLGIGDLIVHVTRVQQKLPPVPEKLPFDVSAHPGAKTSVAQSMLKRMEEDMKMFADNANKTKQPKLRGLTTEAEIRQLIKIGPSANLTELTSNLRSLLTRLNKLRDSDIAYVGKALPIVQKSANTIPMTKDNTDAFLLYLRRFAGQEATLSLDYIMSSLCAEGCEQEWQKLNPFLSLPTCTALINMTAVSILRANRIGHAARTAEAIEGLLGLLAKLAKPPTGVDEATLRGMQESMLASIVQKADTVADTLTTQRVFIKAGDLTYDPRYLIFEFTWNITLRQRQIELISEMYQSTLGQQSLVKQMIMGAGKTTVVGPLLGLMLANGKNLVVQVVPQALLDFSRSILRSTFSCLLTKQIFSFVCDRSSDVDSEVISKFKHAQLLRGIVVTTPSSLKSIFLKYIEVLDQIEDPARAKTPQLEKESEELGKLLSIWKRGVLIMDEVDMLLHPLKSELNFPIGAKHDIDFTPIRWKLPIHLLDAFFYLQSKRITLQIKDSPEAHALLKEFAKAVREGINTNAIQEMPHLTLLNVEYYHTVLKGLIAQWLVLFIKAQHFLGLSDADTITFITSRPTDVDNPELAKKVNELDAGYIKVLNLCFDWLNCFLPHVLQKIDRVSFGIMNEDDQKRAREETPNMPRSRYVTAIPFVGKDLPSPSSEFAHPDIVIGLTVLAYRYEGLRDADFVDIMRDVQSAVEKEVGRYSQRRTNLMYVKWIKASHGKIMSSYAYGQKKKADEEVGVQPGEEPVAEENQIVEVLPLRLMTQANAEEFKKLFRLLRRTPEVIHWYLCENIFPEFMRHQKLKLSASGQELGGDIMFDLRLGFSGTPSDLLPVELGRCDYEPCTEGKLITTLTSPEVVSFTVIEPGWTVRQLLNLVADASPPYHALIDTGALITGMSNLQVAKYLLKHGIPQMEGVVFLDEFDRKMILVRATGRVLKLAECGIPKTKRFAFYDQVHTTGMDIEHMPNAQAILTLGKDMTFRDYSQGAYRMRGIGHGQTVKLLIIPEVYDLILRSLLPTRKEAIPPLHSRKTHDVLIDVSAWLFVNSIHSEHTQHKQLCMQNVSNVWRKEAYGRIRTACNAGEFKLTGKPSEDTLSALNVFRESVDFSVLSKVPKPRLFSETVDNFISSHKKFVVGPAALKVVEGVLALAKAEDEIENPTIDVQMVQEQEEEREQEVEQEKEQEIELEKFVDLEYSRDEEAPDSWKLDTLASLTKAQQFYRLHDFHLYKRPSIQFPDTIALSRNFYNPRWGGYRRLKNVIITMEWTPNATENEVRAKPSRDYGEIPKEIAMAELKRTVLLLRQHQAELAPEVIKDLYTVALHGAISDDPEWGSVIDSTKSVSELDALAERIYENLSSNKLRNEQNGRYCVVVALCEAETLRRVLHLRKRSRESILGKDSKTDVEFALRINSSQNVLLDASFGFRQNNNPYQALKAHQCLRFFDNDFHYHDFEIGMLIRALHCTPQKSRQAFFQQVIACRRRSRQRWEQTPVALVFNLISAYTLLHQKTVGLCMRRELDVKNLPVSDAFMAFNSTHSGTLSAAEIWGGMRFCRLTVSAEEVLDFIDVADTHKEGSLHYADFLCLLTGMRDFDDDEGEEGGEGKKLPQVDMYGLEELKTVQAARQTAIRKMEEEANKEAAAEDERVLQEIEYEFDKEEYDILVAAENPKLDEKALKIRYDFQVKDFPKLTYTQGIINHVPAEKDEMAYQQMMYNSFYRASLRGLKIAGEKKTFVNKYAMTVEFKYPRLSKTQGIREQLDSQNGWLFLATWPTNRYILDGEIEGVEGHSESSEDEEEEYYDEDEGWTTRPKRHKHEEGGSDDGELKLHVYPEPKVNDKVSLYKLPEGSIVEEEVGKRHTCAVDGVTIEWMKIKLPVEGWVIAERSGRALWKQLNLTMSLDDGEIFVDLCRVEVPTAADAANIDYSEWDDIEDDENDEDEEESDHDDHEAMGGDVQDLVDALKKAKELKVGDKVSRNPEGWSAGNEDGGEGSVGKVLKVQEETVTVQWPSGNKGDYDWGKQGNFALIKVADAGEDGEGDDRETFNDERWLNEVKKKNCRCSECQKAGLEAGDWFRCNQCGTGYNLCKKCFRQGLHQEHDFTDMGTLAMPKAGELGVGSWVKLKVGATLKQGSQNVGPEDIGVIIELDEDDHSVIVDFQNVNEEWQGFLDELSASQPPADLMNQGQDVGAWVLNFENKVTTLPFLACMIDAIKNPTVKDAKFKVGDRVKAYWKGGSTLYPAEVRAVLPDGFFAVLFDDNDFEPRQEPDRLYPLGYRVGDKVRIKKGKEPGSFQYEEVPENMFRAVGKITDFRSASYYSYDGAIRVNIEYSNRSSYCVLDSEIEIVHPGKWTYIKNDEPVAFTTSSNVIVEKAFAEGQVKIVVFVKDATYTVRFDTMEMTREDGKVVYKVKRDPDDPWEAKLPPKKFDDGMWHVVTVLYNGENLSCFCDGQNVKVHVDDSLVIVTENQSESESESEEGDDDDEKPKKSKKDKKEKKKDEKKDEAKANVNAEGGEVKEETNAEAENAATEEKEEGQGEGEEQEGEGEEGEGEGEEEGEGEGEEGEGEDEEGEGEEGENEEAEEGEEKDGEGEEKEGEEKEEKEEGEENEEDEESDKESNASEKEREKEREKAKAEQYKYVFGIDFRKPLYMQFSDVSPKEAFDNLGGAMAKGFPRRNVTYCEIEFGSESVPTEEAVIARHKAIDEETKWPCRACQVKNSRLVAECVECGVPRVEQKKEDEGPRGKFIAVLLKSKKAQQIRQKLQAKLRSRYQRELDNLDDMRESRRGGGLALNLGFAGPRGTGGLH